MTQTERRRFLLSRLLAEAPKYRQQIARTVEATYLAALP